MRLSLIIKCFEGFLSPNLLPSKWTWKPSQQIEMQFPYVSVTSLILPMNLHKFFTFFFWIFIISKCHKFCHVMFTKLWIWLDGYPRTFVNIQIYCLDYCVKIFIASACNENIRSHTTPKNKEFQILNNILFTYLNLLRYI